MGAIAGRGGKSIMAAGAAGGGDSAAKITWLIKAAHAAHADRSRDFMFLRI